MMTEIFLKEEECLPGVIRLIIIIIIIILFFFIIILPIYIAQQGKSSTVPNLRRIKAMVDTCHGRHLLKTKCFSQKLKICAE